MDSLNPKELEILYKTIVLRKRTYEVGDEMQMSQTAIWQRMARIRTKIDNQITENAISCQARYVGDALTKYLEHYATRTA